MYRFILIPCVFLPTFAVVMVANQLSYGGCFEGYCIEAAFPKVLLFAAIITAIIVLNASNIKREPIKSNLNNNNSQPKKAVNTNATLRQKVRTSDRARNKGATINTKEFPESCNRLEFGRFEDAARASKILAKTHGVPIKQLRRGSKYYIEIPAGLKSINIDSLLSASYKASLSDSGAFCFTDDDRNGDYEELDDCGCQEAAEELSFELIGDFGKPSLAGSVFSSFSEAAFGYDYQEFDDYDDQEAVKELNFDLSDDADAYARSNEDGWFYSDTDPGWENNVPDRDHDEHFA